MAISDKLTELIETKDKIKTAIESKGQDLTDVEFRDYNTKILEISGGGGSVETPLDIFMNKWGHIVNSEAAFTSSIRTGEVFEWVCPPDVYSVSVVAVGSGGRGAFRPPNAANGNGGRARFEGDDGVYVQGNGGSTSTFTSSSASGGSFVGEGGSGGSSANGNTSGGAGGYNGSNSGGGGTYSNNGGNTFLYGQGTTGNNTNNGVTGSADTLRNNRIPSGTLNLTQENLNIIIRNVFSSQSISGGRGEYVSEGSYYGGAGGGGLGWRNHIPVTPGETYNVYINQNGGSSSAGNAALRIV